ncbi:uncharacterized protein LOC119999557 isoform X1 [Tripterygium wilfordii]|uniref:uncharacterized protein LOC119999557 isoform X1 n=1 Tax=Tripterygium wilfordii TaxID=458696 RepID=UPI0018F82A60|nr:uncharacterized protein LOC119999557 isoform X1 [Tripterygium wilfordii]
MKSQNPVSQAEDPKSRRPYIYTIFPAASLFCLVLFFGSAFVAPDSKLIISRWAREDSYQNSESRKCKSQCRPPGSEALPEGIAVKTSDLKMRPLWGFPEDDKNASKHLFTLPAGIKQKDLVNRMVKKFLSSGFVVMLFHYDGIVDEWKTFEWYDHVIHVSVPNQTKWWFAKRFLHPDIIAEYSYIFLWDEDLGVNHFDPRRYLSIVKKEGLEISQPALDPRSEVHHQLTVRSRNSTVHRRTFKTMVNGTGCDSSSTAPPCTGWIEMMAPVFSKAAWRCVWYMVQNDLIHAWGLDKQLGYCSQGDRTKNVGVVDAEYIVHHNRPTLGGTSDKKALPYSRYKNPRLDVRRQSYIELNIFEQRWKKAAEEDKCWTDPFLRPL